MSRTNSTTNSINSITVTYDGTWTDYGLGGVLLSFRENGALMLCAFNMTGMECSAARLIDDARRLLELLEHPEVQRHITQFPT